MKRFILFFLIFSVTVHAKINEIELMTYNVENLFDTSKDEGKDDWTFLPNKTQGKKEQCQKIKNDKYKKECLGTDWNDKKLELKMNQIKRVVTRGKNKLPHLLALQEVENESVVSMLAKKLGFARSITTNGPDERGVDVALLVNESEDLKVVGFKEHIVSGETLKNKPTRPILEVELSLEDQKLFVFVNHWPSQSNPSLSRVEAAKTVMNRIAQIQKDNSNALIVVTGDFNTLDSDFPHPFKTVLQEGGVLDNVNEMFMNDRSIEWKIKENMPLGTYFYYPKMQWNMLDYVFVSKNLFDKAGWDVDLNSFQIYAPAFATDSKIYKKGHVKHSVVAGAPKGYEHNARTAEKAGFSDHFPVLIKIKK